MIHVGSAGVQYNIVEIWSRTKSQVSLSTKIRWGGGGAGRGILFVDRHSANSSYYLHTYVHTQKKKKKSRGKTTDLNSPHTQKNTHRGVSQKKKKL